jgi:hypothetical protein
MNGANRITFWAFVALHKEDIATFLFGAAGGLVFFLMVFFGHSPEGDTALRNASLYLATFNIQAPGSFILIMVSCCLLAGLAIFLPRLPRPILAISAGFAMAASIVTGTILKEPFKKSGGHDALNLRTMHSSALQHPLFVIASDKPQPRNLIFKLSQNSGKPMIGAVLNVRFYEADRKPVSGFTLPRPVDISNEGSTYCLDISTINFGRPPVVYEISLSSEGFAPIWLSGELRAHELPWQLSLQLEEGGRQFVRDLFGTNIQRQPQASPPAHCSPTPEAAKSA